MTGNGLSSDWPVGYLAVARRQRGLLRSAYAPNPEGLHLSLSRPHRRPGMGSPIEALRDRNPVDFLSQRADALTQRGADLKKLADAWRLFPTAREPVA
jgi:hypothetical protein